MYDQESVSLWSTLKGEPVMGPLCGKGIKLKRRSVVTTTWGEWRQRHPETLVLSLKTGHRRNYDEGRAYRSYFATDKLMFTTPYQDRRLPNKWEVLALRNDSAPEGLAIDTGFLKKHPVYHCTLGEDTLVVLTTSSGESRVYQTSGQMFKKWDGHENVTDTHGRVWSMSEFRLTLADEKKTLYRYPSHQSFWFGWHAQYPKTQLISF